MPKTPVNYSDTIFYKLACRDLTITDIYVGSTTNFRQRKANHKNGCSNEKSKGYGFWVYTFIRGNGGWENWDMIMIHRQSCVDTHEAHTVERGYIESLGATLNSCVPGRTLQEIQEYPAAYYEANKDAIRETHAAYREANKDAIRESSAAYREANKDAIRERGVAYYEANKETRAAYREAHRDANKLYAKQYHANKKLLKQQQPLAELTNQFV